MSCKGFQIYATKDHQASTDPCGFLCPTIQQAQIFIDSYALRFRQLASTDLYRFQCPTIPATNRKMEQRVQPLVTLQYGATIHAEVIRVDSTSPCYNKGAEY